MCTVRAVFSCRLEVDGSAVYTELGDVKAAYSGSGIGDSGCLMCTVTVTLYGVSSDSIPLNASAVLLYGVSGRSPQLYVLRRSVEDSNLTLTLADTMCMTDETLILGDADYDEDGYITFDSLVRKICQKCKFSGFSADSTRLSAAGRIERSECEGKTSRELLDMLSAAMVGYWFCVGSTLMFCPLGEYKQSAGVTDHSNVIMRVKRNISSIVLTDGAGYYGLQIPRALYVNTPFASKALLDAVSGSAGYTYRSWRCEHAVASGWVYPGAVDFTDEGTLLCRNITMTFDRTGIYLSLSADEVTENEVAYKSNMQRQLENRVSYGIINGNAGIRRDGLYFFENGYKDMTPEEQKKARYTFSAEKGVTEYSGAMVSKVVPKSASINKDKTEAVIDYGGKKYKYSIQRDADGNITSLAKEEIKEGSQ